MLTNERILALRQTARRLTRLLRGEAPLDIEWLFANDSPYIVQGPQ